MTEFETIERCFQGWSVEQPNIQLGIGDDCLIWNDPEPLVISTDTAVIGRHFPYHASPEQVAQRAFLPALSDLAAMTANPAFFTLALTLPPHLESHWVEAFAKRLRELAEFYQIALAGGDTTKGNSLTLTVSVHGRCHHPALRSAAQVGDDVWVTGFLGQAAAALPAILEEQDARVPTEWAQAYWQPEPPMAFAESLQGIIHSAIDLSDGLVGDAAHIAKASGVELALDLENIPMDDELKALGEEGLRYAVAGGDDFQLLFTAHPNMRKELQALAFEHQTQLTRIGEVRAGDARVSWWRDQQPVALEWQGYQHF